MGNGLAPFPILFSAIAGNQRTRATSTGSGDTCAAFRIRQHHLIQ
jgi:hypothetical protein